MLENSQNLVLPWHMWRPVTVEIESQGSLLKMKKISSLSTAKIPQNNTRGQVTKFSRKSRKRMLETIARLDRQKVGWGRFKPKFITLTYEENMTDHRKAKRDLKAFVERMQERYPRFACLWKKEQQQRGAIHFHLMVFGTPFLLIHSTVDKKGWQQHWNEVSGNSIDNRNSFDLEIIKSMNGVAFYVAKYMAKADDDDGDDGDDGVGAVPYSQMCPQAQIPRPPTTCPVGLSIVHKFSQASTGRWWGVYGRKNMPYAPRARACVTVPLATLDRWIQECVQSRWARLDGSWTVFRDDAPQRHDGIYRMMESLSSVHADYEHARRSEVEFFAKNHRENSYAPLHIYGIVMDVMRKNRKALLQAHVACNIGPWVPPPSPPPSPLPPKEYSG